jgi:transposase InsO family protein
MGSLFLSLVGALRSTLRTRADLAIENLALRQQLANFQRTSGRPRLRKSDRAFWLVLSRLWSRWADVLVVVKPDTVVRWHRAGFRLFWQWKSRSRGPVKGSISAEVRQLIRQIAKANPLWGTPKVHGELLKLGIDIGERSVSRLMPPRPRKPPSQNWRTFLNNHLSSLASIDFFVVPTATFRVLYVFLVLAHHRRRIMHFNVTEHPSAQWTAQQIVEAFPEDTAPKYMIRDRDGIYGDRFRRRVQGLGIEEVLTAPQSPWQSPYVERLVGSVRRECVDHVIVLDERHLRRILTAYFAYYHKSRTHLSLGKDAPEPRAIHPPSMGRIVELSEVGGLHHRYERLAA